MPRTKTAKTAKDANKKNLS